MNPRSAERLVRAARAAQALSETLWEALHEELASPTASRVTKLSQRLADVSATVALLAGADTGLAAPVQSPAASARTGAGNAPVVHGERSGGDSVPASPVPPTPRSTPPSRGAIHTEPTPPPRSFAAPETSATGEIAHSRGVLIDELAPESPIPEAPPAPPEPGASAVQEIEIRDERHEEARHEGAPGEHSPGPWIAAIERRLERYERDRAPFAVLVVELADIERLRHAELPGEVSRLTGLVQAALEDELRPADSLTRESPGRYWLLAPDTDIPASRELIERLAGAVRGAASHRGVPLEVAVGVAVCSAEGTRAAALAAHAEVALYAARASGKPVT